MSHEFLQFRSHHLQHIFSEDQREAVVQLNISPPSPPSTGSALSSPRASVFSFEVKGLESEDSEWKFTASPSSGKTNILSKEGVQIRASIPDTRKPFKKIFWVQVKGIRRFFFMLEFIPGKRGSETPVKVSKRLDFESLKFSPTLRLKSSSVRLEEENKDIVGKLKELVVEVQSKNDLLLIELAQMKRNVEKKDKMLVEAHEKIIRLEDCVEEERRKNSILEKQRKSSSGLPLLIVIGSLIAIVAYAVNKL